MQSSDASPLPPPAARRNPLKAVLAWLLELNRPVPHRTEDELFAEVARNYSWNFAVNLLDGTLFMFGASFISATTILPLFLSKLTTNPLAFGILAVTAQAGWFLPQLFTANLTERLARKKPVVVNLGVFLERIPVWIMVLGGHGGGHRAEARDRAAAGRLRLARRGRRRGRGLMAGSARALLPGQPPRTIFRPDFVRWRGRGRVGRTAEHLATESL